MKLTKAIELLSTIDMHPVTPQDADYRHAIKLGIEALKKWQTLRQGRAGIIDPLLPGETPDSASP